jgi:serine/threonine-protein kinase
VKLPDRYKVVGSPLEGGMSSVHLCTDSVLERKVAIKVVSPTTGKRRVLDEITALLKLRSKHVVQVYDVLALPGDQLAIVQEFVAGTELDVKKSPIASADALYRQLWQIASGIADIHAAGLIHRDIKPNNMKRNGEGVIKIFDFGLARSEGPDAKTKGFVEPVRNFVCEAYHDHQEHVCRAGRS